MNNNESRSLWISIGAGLFSAFLLYSYSQEKKAEYDKVYGTLKRVVIARVDINEMQTIDDTMLEVTQRPSDFIEPSSISDPDVAFGQVAATAIKKGEQILLTKLLQPGPDTGIALQVSPGKRAITLPVDEMRAVAKLIRPGDRVDIFSAIDTGKGLTAKKEIFLLMQDVVVLATGVNVQNNIPRLFEMDSNTKNITQTTLTSDTKYNTITVEASIKEAQDLIYILSTSPANLFLTLRNPNDRSIPPRLPSSTSESITGRSSMIGATAPGIPLPSISGSEVGGGGERGPSSAAAGALAPLVPASQPPAVSAPKVPQKKKSPGGFKQL